MFLTQSFYTEKLSSYVIHQRSQYIKVNINKNNTASAPKYSAYNYKSRKYHSINIIEQNSIRKHVHKQNTKASKMAED